jgi:16S rRNA (adenine1518-N6/adenine1519-N6)-dimethyltransferase
LGQHFLTDDSAAIRIVEALGDVSQKTVLEIGPGRGVISSLLARRARRLIAIEIDRVLAAQLRMKFALYPNVEIIEGDVLAIDFSTLFGPKPGASRPGLVQTLEPVHVVGNLPYYITSDILLHLFEYRQCFNTIVIMVQKEVADRLSASPGTREYGLLSETAQLFSRIE